MQFQIFNVTEDKTEELNRFLSSHTILSIRKTYDQTNQFWSFCVEYLEEDMSTPVETENKNLKDYKEKLKQYKETLSPEDYEKFMLLRKCRRIVANELQFPPYIIFNDKELLKLLDKDITLETLKSIKRSGEDRLNRFVELWNMHKTEEKWNDVGFPR